MISNPQILYPGLAANLVRALGGQGSFASDAKVAGTRRGPEDPAHPYLSRGHLHQQHQRYAVQEGQLRGEPNYIKDYSHLFLRPSDVKVFSYPLLSINNAFQINAPTEKS